MRFTRGGASKDGRASVMAAKAKRKAGVLAMLLVLALLFAVGCELMNTRGKLALAEAEQSALAERVARQEQENRSLEAALARSEDPEYLRQLAREQLGMVSPGQKDFYDVSH